MQSLAAEGACGRRDDSSGAAPPLMPRDRVTPKLQTRPGPRRPPAQVGSRVSYWHQGCWAPIVFTAETV